MTAPKYLSTQDFQFPIPKNQGFPSQVRESAKLLGQFDLQDFAQAAIVELKPEAEKN